jgi:hypothetical protein
VVLTVFFIFKCHSSLDVTSFHTNL